MVGKLPPKASTAAINAMFAVWQGANPSPQTELLYGNAFQLLVAVVLSAQATDKGVNKATAPLFEAIKTPAQMLALGEAGLTTYIKTIGLFRAKAKNVMGLSAALIEKHGGEVPRAREALQALPGVGRKTASVVLNALWGEPTIAVDTHVFRVAHRLGLARGNTPDKVEDELSKVIPPEFKQHAHHWLILHGRYTCTARSPKCAECKVAAFCKSSDKLK
jgi:endonuclease III